MILFLFILFTATNYYLLVFVSVLRWRLEDARGINNHSKSRGFALYERKNCIQKILRDSMRHGITKTIHELFVLGSLQKQFLPKCSFFNPSSISDLISQNAWNESNSSWLRIKNDQTRLRICTVNLGCMHKMPLLITNLSNYWRI